MLFGRAAVIHGEGIHIKGHIATGQCAKINGLALDPEPQYGGVDTRHPIKPGGCVRIHALAQGGRRGHGTQIQGAGKERILALTFDGIKVVFTQTEQTKVAFENVAIRNPAAHREGRVNQGIEIQVLEILANQSQPGVVAQIVGQLLDNKIGHAQ
jgi:hypothetical protein